MSSEHSNLSLLGECLQDTQICCCWGNVSRTLKYVAAEKMSSGHSNLLLLRECLQDTPICRCWGNVFRTLKSVADERMSSGHQICRCRENVFRTSKPVAAKRMSSGYPDLSLPRECFQETQICCCWENVLCTHRLTDAGHERSVLTSPKKQDQKYCGKSYRPVWSTKRRWRQKVLNWDLTEHF